MSIYIIWPRKQAHDIKDRLIDRFFYYKDHISDRREVNMTHLMCFICKCTEDAYAFLWMFNNSILPYSACTPLAPFLHLSLQTFLLKSVLHIRYISSDFGSLLARQPSSRHPNYTMAIRLMDITNVLPSDIRPIIFRFCTLLSKCDSRLALHALCQE